MLAGLVSKGVTAAVLALTVVVTGVAANPAAAATTPQPGPVSSAPQGFAPTTPAAAAPQVVPNAPLPGEVMTAQKQSAVSAGRYVDPPRVRAYYIARSQVGYTENSDGWSKYGQWYYPPYARGAWCAMFISWVYAAAGRQTPIETAKGFHNVFGGFNVLLRRHQIPGWGWLRFGQARPQHLMDIAFINVPGGHVGLVVSWNARGAYLIEGNVRGSDGRYRVMYTFRPYNQIAWYSTVLPDR